MNSTHEDFIADRDEFLRQQHQNRENAIALIKKKSFKKLFSLSRQDKRVIDALNESEVEELVSGKNPFKKRIQLTVVSKNFKLSSIHRHYLDRGQIEIYVELKYNVYGFYLSGYIGYVNERTLVGAESYSHKSTQDLIDLLRKITSKHKGIPFKWYYSFEVGDRFIQNVYWSDNCPREISSTLAGWGSKPKQFLSQEERRARSKYFR